MQFSVSSLKQEANVLQENAFDNAQQMTTKAYQTQMDLAQAKFNYATQKIKVSCSDIWTERNSSTNSTFW